jgi:hypothetical protein
MMESERVGWVMKSVDVDVDEGKRDRNDWDEVVWAIRLGGSAA